ncbi:MAG: hypothetical protein OXN93_11690 [bacterium]|nr:hypothetical protein [bacterium]
MGAPQQPPPPIPRWTRWVLPAGDPRAFPKWHWFAFGAVGSGFAGAAIFRYGTPALFVWWAACLCWLLADWVLRRKAMRVAGSPSADGDVDAVGVPARAGPD